MKTTIAALGIACLAITLSGCGNVEDPLQISEVSMSSSSLDIDASQHGAITTIVLWLYPQARPERCPVLTDRAKATINGMPVDLEPGDGFTTYYSGELVCHPPMIHADVPSTPGLTTIVISDDTGEISVTVDLSQRTWSVLPEGRSDLYAGETIELGWSNPTDQFIPGWASPQLKSGPSDQGAYIDPNTVAISGNVVSFTAPNKWNLEPGAWTLSMSTKVQVQPNLCLGLEYCAVTLYTSFERPVTVLSP